MDDDGGRNEGRARQERARDIFARCIFHGVTRARAHPSSAMLTSAENTAAGDIYLQATRPAILTVEKMRVIAAAVTFRLAEESLDAALIHHTFCGVPAGF